MPKRGRPPKFNRPSRLVAMTLPEDVIETLRSRDQDLARAVVEIVGETNGHGRTNTQARKETPQLVRIAPRRFLITVNRKVVKHLPGCELVPLGGDAAFVALQPGSGLSDLALAVVDRLEEPSLDADERSALLKLREALRAYVRDKTLAHEVRSIMVLRKVLTTGAVLLCNWHEPLAALACL
jgi:hypothetical protein